MVLFGGVHGFFTFFGYNEIRSMSGRYASYWNAFLFISFVAGVNCQSLALHNIKFYGEHMNPFRFPMLV